MPDGAEGSWARQAFDAAPSSSSCATTATEALEPLDGTPRCHTSCDPHPRPPPGSPGGGSVQRVGVLAYFVDEPWHFAVQHEPDRAVSEQGFDTFGERAPS
jgi:hypothetical protein